MNTFYKIKFIVFIGHTDILCKFCIIQADNEEQAEERFDNWLTSKLSRKLDAKDPVFIYVIINEIKQIIIRNSESTVPNEHGLIYSNFHELNEDRYCESRFWKIAYMIDTGHKWKKKHCIIKAYTKDQAKSNFILWHKLMCKGEKLAAIPIWEITESISIEKYITMKPMVYGFISAY